MVEKKDVFLASDVKNINIESTCSNLTIEEADTEEIVIRTEYNENEVQEYRCKLHNGSLDISHKWKRGSHTDGVSDVIEIVIPAGTFFENLSLKVEAGNAKLLSHTTEYGRATIEIGAGNLSMEALKATGNVDIEVGAGNVSILQIDAKTVNAECGAGKLNIYGKVDGDLNVECGVGKVKLDLDEEESAYNYQVSCGIGSVRINGTKRGGLFAGRNSIQNANAKGTMNLSCGVGSIQVITK